MMHLNDFIELLKFFILIIIASNTETWTPTWVCNLKTVLSSSTRKERAAWTEDLESFICDNSSFTCHFPNAHNLDKIMRAERQSGATQTSWWLTNHKKRDHIITIGDALFANCQFASPLCRLQAQLRSNAGSISTQNWELAHMQAMRKTQLTK